MEWGGRDVSHSPAPKAHCLIDTNRGQKEDHADARSHSTRVSHRAGAVSMTILTAGVTGAHCRCPLVSAECDAVGFGIRRAWGRRAPKLRTERVAGAHAASGCHGRVRLRYGVLRLHLVGVLACTSVELSSSSTSRSCPHRRPLRAVRRFCARSLLRELVMEQLVFEGHRDAAAMLAQESCTARASSSALLLQELLALS